MIPAEQPDQRRILPLADVERSHILRTLAHPEIGGNRQLAASLLKISRTTLYRKLREYRGETKPA